MVTRQSHGKDAIREEIAELKEKAKKLQELEARVRRIERLLEIEREEPRE